MKAIRNWDDLEEYGIDLLTGESCAYGYRVLCDVTEAGSELLKECFGLAGSLPLPGPWNNRGIGSIMLPRDMFEPLAVFALIKAGCPKIAIMRDGVYGQQPEEDQERFVAWATHGPIRRMVNNPGFSRNRHAFSGRTS